VVSTLFPERNRLDVAEFSSARAGRRVCRRLRSIPFNPVELHAVGQVFTLGLSWLYVVSPRGESASLVHINELRLKTLRLGAVNGRSSFPLSQNRQYFAFSAAGSRSLNGPAGKCQRQADRARDSAAARRE